MKNINILFILLIIPSIFFAQSNEFNNVTYKPVTFKKFTHFGTDDNQVLVCLYLNKRDFKEMTAFSKNYSGKVKLISLSDYKSDIYQDVSKYRYVLTQDGYTMIDKNNITVKSFTMFCIYDIDGGLKHIHNRDRNLDRYFSLMEKRKLSNLNQ